MDSQKTKKKLTGSVLALIVCFAMLLGTTFAWFTDVASTNVNKIQAGTLNVALQMKTADDPETWESVEGETLNFVKAAGHENEAILWEPGCTYNLPELRVVNEGNLALKYKIQITGIDGDEKLNEVIEWSANDAELDQEYSLGTDKNSKTSKSLTISAHMKESAGNAYQGLSIEGVAITVLATQDTVEYDSKNNTYDENATYATDGKNVSNATDFVAAVKSGNTVVLTKNIQLNKAVTLGDNVTIDGNGYTISGHPVWAGNNNVIKNVIFDSPVNNDNNASCLHANGNITLDGCTFKNTQWDAVQIAGDLAGKSITINNCTFKPGVGDKVKRYVHIQVENGSACTAKVNITLTNNKFSSSDKVKDDIIGIYGVDESCINYGGNNTFADTNGTVWIGWSTNKYADNQSGVYAKLTGK